MNDETVLNYKNAETAMVALWLENERPMYEAARNMARAAFDRGELGLDEAPAVTLGDEFRRLIENRPAVLLVTEGPNPDDLAHVASLLTCALGRVDWRELGRQWVAEAAEDADRQ